MRAWRSGRTAERRPAPPSEPGEVAAAVEAELVAAGRRHTVAGELAVSLARRVDATDESSSTVATLSREFRACLAAAMAGALPGPDPLDELRARRERQGPTRTPRGAS